MTYSRYNAPVKVEDFLRQSKQMLMGVSETPLLDAELLLAAVLEKPREFLLARPQYLLSPRQRQKAGVFLQQRLRGEPVAYILGECEFYGLRFGVDPSVLVPRPETELLVEQTVARLQQGGTLIDVGTGSGCIPVAVAKNTPPLRIIALDIEAAALNVARRNAERYDVAIDFRLSDLLAAVEEDLRPGSGTLPEPVVITANLPYCPSGDRHPSTAKEPPGAIYSGEDGMDLLRRFFRELAPLSFDVCLFEFHPPQRAELEAICSRLFPAAEGEFFKDLAGDFRAGIVGFTKKAVHDVADTSR